MNTPMQHRPVERQVASASFSAGARDNAPRAVAPSGIEASGVLDDIMKVATPILGTLGPLLGGLI